MVDADGGNVVQDVVVGTRPRRLAATPDDKGLSWDLGMTRDFQVIRQ
jgi:hypothetical protein